jgi:Protein of unknown function DUF262
MKRKVIPTLTVEQQKEKAKADFLGDATPLSLIPAPTRTFAVGEEVRIGNLKEVFIEEVLDGGMTYLYRCTWSDRDTAPHIQYRCAWWFDIRKAMDTTAAPRLMSPYRLYPAISTGLDSMLHPMMSGGIVCDPTYQRAYVWTDTDKDALIESIFDRLDIGSFLFLRNHGYLHVGDTSSKEYRTLDGRIVNVPRREDYTMAVIDGQQRLTTIVDFVLDRRPYKGVYFSQLHPRDRNEFEQSSVMLRIVKEDDVTHKDIVRMFLQSNRGVPQSPAHLDAVQALYESLE